MTETLHNHHHENLHPMGIEQIKLDEKAEKEFNRHEADRQTQEKILSARKNIEQQALSKESTAIEGESESQPMHQAYLTKHIKYDRYKLTLEHLRGHLNSPERQFSRFIHKPAVEAVSEWSSKTIARPSGILGGSFLALLGSLIIIVLAKRIGFRVPNSIFIVLFLGGFALGIFAELGIASIKKLVSRK